MVWKYTNIQHAARKFLGLSPNEYCVADIIYKTQTHPEIGKDGWTNLSVHTIAESLDFSSGTIKKMLDKFAENGLLEFKDPDKKRLKRMLPKWYNTAYLEPENLPELPADPEKVQKVNVQKVNEIRSKSERKNGESVQKVNKNCSKSEHYNNIKEVSLNKERKKKEDPQAKSLHSLCKDRFDFWAKEAGYDPIYWDRKEIGQLQQLINRLQDGAKTRGFSVTSHEQFLKDVFDVFCGSFIEHCRNEWFAETLTPSGLVQHYNKIVQTIKLKINGKGTSKGGHKSGHLISAADAAEIFESLEKSGY